MKRLVSLVILIVGLLLAGFPGRAMAQTANSAVTVVVQEYIAIPAALPAMTITVIIPGEDAAGTSVFDVDANVATTVSVGTIIQPTLLTGLKATVSFTGTTPGTKVVTLTGEIGALLLMTRAVDSYTGGSIQVTVTAP